MTNQNILISGASIAGPSLAYWLNRRGFTTTVVERAPKLREGGQAIDFRGEQMEVLRRMGILDEVRRMQTNAGEMVFIDEQGRRTGGLPDSFAGGEVEILRGDLSRILYDASRDDTEYVFGDWITSLVQTPDGVEVTFEHGEPRVFDLVIGADGVHSGVRGLTFGAEAKFRTDIGYYIAGFTTDNYLGLDHTSWTYNEPGRGVTVTSSRTPAEAGIGFVFASERLDYDRRDTEQQKQILADAFAGMRWEAPKLIEAMWRTPDLYFDSISQIHLDRYTSGRVALVGDAGWCAGPGGSGTGLAMVAGYVLAGELAAVNGDHRVAFPRYEEQVRAAAVQGLKQGKGSGSFLAPKTASGIKWRNRGSRMLSTKLMARSLDKMSSKAANMIAVRDY